MSIFNADVSTQGSGGLPTYTRTYSTQDYPITRMYSKSGIYNPSDNVIKFYTNNLDALTIDANQKVICNGSLITNLDYNNISTNKPTLFDGTWGSLSGKPSLFDGTWGSLSGKPTNFQADWNTTIINKPTLFDGTWTSLSGKPTNFQADWNTTILNKPILFDGTWTSLSGKPTNFQADWNTTILNKPILFDGTWTSLSEKPTLFDGTWTSLSGKPTLFDGTWISLSGKPTNFQADWNTTIINKPTLFDGTWTSLSGKPTLFDGTWISLSGKPTNFQADWNTTIINKPDLSGYATTTQLATKQNTLTSATALVGNGSAITSLNYNNITNPPSLSGYATTTQLAGKQDTLSASTSLLGNGANITNLAYANITGKPTNFQADWNTTIINKPDLSGLGSKWTLNGTSIYYNGGNVGIGTNNPSQKLHIEDGSIFIGDSAIGVGALVNNGFRLIFDNSFTNAGDNRCNKIVMHNNQTGIGYLAGLGIESGGIVYSVWTTGTHRFYTDTTSTSGGFLVADIRRDQFNIYGNTDGSVGQVILNTSAGGSAHTYIVLRNNTGFGFAMFLNSTARSADGGVNGGTLRNDVGDLRLSAKNNTPQIFLQESTDRIYMDGTINIRQNDGDGAFVVPNNYMQQGSLTIGSVNLNYGWGSGANANMSGLMLECADITEIAVHDNGMRFASLLAYQGGSSYNHIHIGRDMGGGWGTAWVVNFPGAQIAFASEWYIYKGTTPTNVVNSLIFNHITSTINSRWWLNGTQTNTSSDISDERIKKEIKDIDNSLEKLSLLKPKEYCLCSDKDYVRKYGIIAQDVNKEECLKHLIFTDKEYIANLLTNVKFIKEKIGEEEVILEHPEEKYIKSEDNPTPYPRQKPKEIFKYTLTTEKNLNGLINIDDELKICLDNDNKDNIEIVIDDTPYNNRYKKRFVKVKSIIDDYTFEIYEDITDINDKEKDNLFIYGKKVDDFLKLDYESLYCLNIDATIQLYNLIKEQKRIIDNQKKEIIDIYEILRRNGLS